MRFHAFFYTIIPTALFSLINTTRADGYPAFVSNVDIASPILVDSTYDAFGRVSGGHSLPRVIADEYLYNVIDPATGTVLATDMTLEETRRYQIEWVPDETGMYRMPQIEPSSHVFHVRVEKDGYQLNGQAQIAVGEYQRGAQLPSASVQNWGSTYRVPWYDPEKPIDPSQAAIPAITTNYTFWWNNVATSVGPYGATIPFFMSPTYKHGYNSITEFDTFFGYGTVFGPSSLVYAVDSLHNNRHNEGGFDHRPTYFVASIPTVPYQAGTQAKYAGEKSEWFPSSSTARLNSVELWQAVRSGGYVTTKTYQLPRFESVKSDQWIWIKLDEFANLLAQNKLIEGVLNADLPLIRRVSRIEEADILVPVSAEARGNISEEAYLAKEYNQIQRKANPLAWPLFDAVSVDFTNVANLGFVRVKPVMRQETP